MRYPALLHSLEDDKHSHSQPLTEVEVLKWDHLTNETICKKDDGTVCTGVFNVFVGKMFVNDVYGIIRKENE